MLLQILAVLILIGSLMMPSGRKQLTGQDLLRQHGFRQDASGNITTARKPAKTPLDSIAKPLPASASTPPPVRKTLPAMAGAGVPVMPLNQSRMLPNLGAPAQSMARPQAYRPDPGLENWLSQLRTRDMVDDSMPIGTTQAQAIAGGAPSQMPALDSPEMWERIRRKSGPIFVSPEGVRFNNPRGYEGLGAGGMAPRSVAADGSVANTADPAAWDAAKRRLGIQVHDFSNPSVQRMVQENRDKNARLHAIRRETGIPYRDLAGMSQADLNAQFGDMMSQLRGERMSSREKALDARRQARIDRGLARGQALNRRMTERSMGQGGGVPAGMLVQQLYNQGGPQMVAEFLTSMGHNDLQRMQAQLQGARDFAQYQQADRQHQERMAGMDADRIQRESQYANELAMRRAALVQEFQGQGYNMEQSRTMAEATAPELFSPDSTSEVPPSPLDAPSSPAVDSMSRARDIEIENTLKGLSPAERKAWLISEGMSRPEVERWLRRLNPGVRGITFDDPSGDSDFWHYLQNWDPWNEWRSRLTPAAQTKEGRTIYY